MNRLVPWGGLQIELAPRGGEWLMDAPTIDCRELRPRPQGGVLETGHLMKSDKKSAAKKKSVAAAKKTSSGASAAEAAKPSISASPKGAPVPPSTPAKAAKAAGSGSVKTPAVGTPAPAGVKGGGSSKIKDKEQPSPVVSGTQASAPKAVGAEPTLPPKETAKRAGRTAVDEKPPQAAPVRATPTPTGSDAKPASGKGVPVKGAPPILLEGDAGPVTVGGGPGQRYVLGPAGGGSAGQGKGISALPTAYGTGKLLLVARDPHWLYAAWDLTMEQQKAHVRASVGGHLVVRVRVGSMDGEVAVEQSVHPESRNWFLHVPQAGARYVAELGYYGKGKVWKSVAFSAATVTPAEGMSEETWVQFETLPVDVPMATLVALVREAVAEHVPLVEALAQLRAEGYLQLPGPESVAGAEWTAEQEEALSRVLTLDEVRRVWIGSLEITELVRRQWVKGISSGELPVGSPGVLSGVSSVSSPWGGGEGRGRDRGFWFNVNAELIVYGATDPAATVRVGGRPIRLRPDGTFSYHFALPDGQHALPVEAISPDGEEVRKADLTFSRRSAYRGEVGVHPQDRRLRPPAPEHVE